MKARSSHRFIWFELGALLTLFAVGVGWVPAPHSRAPQSNRQLQRDRTQPNGASGRRVALVIGNGAYTNAPPLKNPPNDTRDMAATLKVLGFEVVSGINVNQRDMKRLIRDFGQTLKAGGSGLFYYAGHGVQSKGHNYLVPVDADIQSEAEMEDSGVDVNLVLNYMDDAQNGLNIVILDPCRNNPFSRSFRSASSGLAQVEAPTGTLIAYATAPGRVASDGTGQNGLYTSELLKQMRVPGLSATEMFMHVRAEVMKHTGNKQVPWEASSLVGMFYFSPPRNNAPTQTGTAANATTIDPVAVERDYWATIRNSCSPQDYRDYLTSYPNGAYSAIAKTRLQRLEAAKDEASKSSGNPNGGNAGEEITTASGLKYVDLVVGDGASPQTGQTVTVHYTGTLESGAKFDSSYDRGEPADFRMGIGAVLKGWDEGMMSMKVGGKRKLIIPCSLGYGSMGRPPDIPGYATIVFVVELLGPN